MKVGRVQRAWVLTVCGARGTIVKGRHRLPQDLMLAQKIARLFKPELMNSGVVDRVREWIFICFSREFWG